MRALGLFLTLCFSLLPIICAGAVQCQYPKDEKQDVQSEQKVASQLEVLDRVVRETLPPIRERPRVILKHDPEVLDLKYRQRRNKTIECTGDFSFDSQGLTRYAQIQVITALYSVSAPYAQTKKVSRLRFKHTVPAFLIAAVYDRAQSLYSAANAPFSRIYPAVSNYLRVFPDAVLPQPISLIRQPIASNTGNVYDFYAENCSLLLHYFEFRNARECKTAVWRALTDSASVSETPLRLYMRLFAPLEPDMTFDAFARDITDGMPFAMTPEDTRCAYEKGTRSLCAAEPLNNDSRMRYHTDLTLCEFVKRYKVFENRKEVQQKLVSDFTHIQKNAPELCRAQLKQIERIVQRLEQQNGSQTAALLADFEKKFYERLAYIQSLRDYFDRAENELSAAKRSLEFQKLYQSVHVESYSPLMEKYRAYLDFWDELLCRFGR